MRFVVDFHAVTDGDVLVTSLLDAVEVVGFAPALVGTDVELDDGEGHVVRGTVLSVDVDKLVTVKVDWSSWRDERLTALVPSSFVAPAWVAEYQQESRPETVAAGREFVGFRRS